MTEYCRFDDDRSRVIRVYIFILVVCRVPWICELMAYTKFRKPLTSFSVPTYLF